MLMAEAFTLNEEIQEYLFHLPLNIVGSIFFSQFQLFLVIADIMNKKPQLAWKLYLKMETSADSFNLLQLIANDCYKVSFLFRAWCMTYKFSDCTNSNFFGTFYHCHH